jgi:hypothetical protein
MGPWDSPVSTASKAVCDKREDTTANGETGTDNPNRGAANSLEFRNGLSQTTSNFERAGETMLD